MTSPPLTNREYAYFYISGPGKHEKITETLGIEPSEAWNVGDIHPQSGKPCKLMRWCMSSGLDDTQSLDTHIQALLFSLHTKADAIRALWLDYDLTLQCVGYFPPSGHGMHFNREHIRKVAQLGLAVDLDFYYVDDFGHHL